MPSDAATLMIYWAARSQRRLLIAKRWQALGCAGGVLTAKPKTYREIAPPCRRLATFAASGFATSGLRSRLAIAMAGFDRQKVAQAKLLAVANT